VTTGLVVKLDIAIVSAESHNVSGSDAGDVWQDIPQNDTLAPIVTDQYKIGRLTVNISLHFHRELGDVPQTNARAVDRQEINVKQRDRAGGEPKPLPICANRHHVLTVGRELDTIARRGEFGILQQLNTRSKILLRKSR
jgi:hypothetical protein